MTQPNSEAWYHLERTVRRYETIVFGRPARVGNLVFMYHRDEYKWRPYWVVAEENGKYEVEAAYGDTRIFGVNQNDIGFGADENGKIIT